MADGWTVTSGAWSAASGYMAPTTTSGTRGFSKNQKGDDGTLRFRYRNNDTSNVNYYLRVMTRQKDSAHGNTRVDVRFYPGYALLNQFNGTSWATLDINQDADSAQDTWYTATVRLDGSHVEVWWAEDGATEQLILDTDSATVLDTLQVYFYEPDGAHIDVDDISFTAADPETVVFAYNDANELVAQTQAGFETTFTYDDWGRMVTKAQAQNSYQATYRWRYGSKLKVAQSNFPGEGDVGYMYDGLGKRRFRQADVESANIDTWYRWDTKGHVLAEYENDTSTFWAIGDMSMYLVPGSVLAQSSGSSPGIDAMHYHHDDAAGKAAIMTDDERDVTHLDTQTGNPDKDSHKDDDGGSGVEASSGEATGDDGDAGRDADSDGDGNADGERNKPDVGPVVWSCWDVMTLYLHLYTILDDDGDGEGTRYDFGPDGGACAAVQGTVCAKGKMEKHATWRKRKNDICVKKKVDAVYYNDLKKNFDDTVEDPPYYSVIFTNCWTVPITLDVMTQNGNEFACCPAYMQYGPGM